MTDTKRLDEWIAKHKRRMAELEEHQIDASDVQNLASELIAEVERLRGIVNKPTLIGDFHYGDCMGDASMKKWRAQHTCGAGHENCPGWHMEGNTKVYHSFADFCDD